MIDLPASPAAYSAKLPAGRYAYGFAPGRFLVPAPTPDIVRQFEALQTAGVGALFTIDGKWRTFALTGPGAERLLSSAIDLAKVLANRSCAALHLFDCPTVLACRAGAFDVWVEGSYAAGLRDRLHAALRTSRTKRQSADA